MAFIGNGAQLTDLDAGDITSGTVGTARLASGTANSSTYLRGDQTWAAVSGGVTSLNGQTGAITNTTVDSIGSVIYGAVNTTSGLIPGNTVSGSIVYIPNAVTSISNTQLFSNGNASTRNWTYWSTTISAERMYEGNSGYQVPLGASTLSGTWRLLNQVTPRNSSYDSCNGLSFTGTKMTLLVRVS
jgi:hypothetical protein